ncbi:MAG: phosphatase PAP2 family protein [Acidobacteria bacterium]|nr:phosphatase PAP2 family protein [Acidobacteriota bacterium]MCA1627645.1 phosphatase PAP2 family protein [Acidobacteriota bacterium]
MSVATSKRKRLLEILSAWLTLGLLAAIATLIFLGWLADEVLEGSTRQFDDATRAAVHTFASPPMTLFMRAISFLGSTEFLTVASIIAIALLALRRWGREAKLFALTIIGASILNITLKLAFQRPRPVPFFNLTAPESFSFPSGHSLASCCFFAGLAAILSGRIKHKRPRMILWTIAIIMFLLIGLSRIYLGVHYTTDVIAGFAAASIWILVVRYVEIVLTRRRKLREQRASQLQAQLD